MSWKTDLNSCKISGKQSTKINKLKNIWQKVKAINTDGLRHE